jgi:hypothetical protein
MFTFPHLNSETATITNKPIATISQNDVRKLWTSCIGTPAKLNIPIALSKDAVSGALKEHSSPSMTSPM